MTSPLALVAAALHALWLKRGGYPASGRYTALLRAVERAPAQRTDRHGHRFGVPQRSLR